MAEAISILDIGSTILIGIGNDRKRSIPKTQIYAVDYYPLNEIVRLVHGSDSTNLDWRLITTPNVSSGIELRDALLNMVVYTGNTGGFTSVGTSVIPTAEATYTAGDNIGGIIEIPNAVRKLGGTGILNDLFITDIADQKANLIIRFWKSSPSSGNYTDQETEDISGDSLQSLGRLDIPSTSWTTTSGIAEVKVVDKERIGLTAATDSTSIFLTVSTPDTPTYVQDSLVLKQTILQD